MTGPDPSLTPGGHWLPLPRARMRPAGPPGGDAFTWGTRVLAGAAALACVAVLVVFLRPIPLPPQGHTELDPVILEASPMPPAQDVAARRETLARLTRDNLFAADRLPWRDGAPGSQPRSTTPARPLPTGESAVLALAPGAVPDDLRKAFENLELKGVFVSPDGVPAAMISRVHTPDRPFSRTYRAGDSFTDEAHPQTPWEVVSIDPRRARVILRRQGAEVPLDLYRRRAPDTVSAGRSAQPNAIAPGPVPAVVRMTPDEIAAALRGADVGEDEIAALLALINQPELSDSPAVIAAQPDPAPGERRAPPPGMEGVLRMMAEEVARLRSERGRDKPAPTAPRP